MNELAFSQSAKNYSSTCADLLTMAEQEFAALFNAVKALFGAHQADLSAEDWLREVKAINGLPVSAREWRQLTVKVAARLANRLKAAEGAA